MLLEKENLEIKKREPLKLLKNIRFPTYQLYGEISNEKTEPIIALKIAILETMSWLRKRFRELEIPPDIDLPEPQDYKMVSLEDFKSFRINEGYLVEVVFTQEYEKDDIIWSFHLIEPDLGPDPGNLYQNRPPIPGRVFETNIAFILHKGKVECGFKTICSEPEGTNMPCEVFRMAVVKSIVRNKLLGLKQICPIIEEPHTIDSIAKIKRFRDFANNKDRQLPIVIVAEYQEKPDISKINIDILNNGFVSRDFVPIELIKDDLDASKDKVKLPIDVEKIAKIRMAYAQFFILKLDKIEDYNKSNPEFSLSQGDIRVIHPLKVEEESCIYKYNNIAKNSKFIETLYEKIEQYPKNKIIEFGNVKFLFEARLEEQQNIIGMSNSKEDITNAYELAIGELEGLYKEEIEKQNTIINNKNNKINKLNYRIANLELEIARKSKEWEESKLEIEDEFRKKIEELEKENNRKDQLLDRPKKIEDIPKWAEKYLEGKLIFHERAADLITKVKSDKIDIELLCDAIEFLAIEYRDERLKLISEEEKNSLCNKKYNRPFTITPSGKKSIEDYPKEYKIKYKIGPKGKPVEVPLDMHLKVGIGKENLIRIYFYYDKEKDLVVVGSLPYHLKAVNRVK